MNPKTRQTLGYFSTFFILGAVISSLGPTLTGIAGNLSRDPSKLGILFSVRSLGYLSGSLLGGYLYEKFRGHWVMTAALITAALALFLTPLLHLLVPLLIILYFTGMGLGSMDIGSNTLLSNVHRKGSRPLLNTMYLLAGAGSFLTPLLLSKLDLIRGYWSLGSLSLLGIIWLVVTPSPELTNDTAEDDRSVQGSIPLIIFCILAFLFIGTEISFGGWIFTFFRKLHPGSEQAAYTVTSVFWLAITIGRLLSIPVSRFIKSSSNIYLFLAGGIISAGLMLLFPEQIWSIWVGTAGTGLSLSAIFPTTFHYVQSTSSLQTKSFGLVWAFGSLGGMILPWLSGELFSRLGPLSLLAASLVGWITALILFTLLYKTYQGSKPT